jgi:DNA-binding Xre family transcriptional regulator
MPKRKPQRLTDQIRHAMDDCGVTRYRISQETGLDESALSKFYNQERGLSLESVDRLCEFLGLRIVMDRKPQVKGK